MFYLFILLNLILKTNTLDLVLKLMLNVKIEEKLSIVN